MAAHRSELLRASPPMFQSRMLDRLSRVHPAVPPVIFLPVIVLAFALGLSSLSVLEAIALAGGGYLFWTLTEYWLHRLVFHFEPEDGFGARLHWIIHGVHHHHPNDPLRLVMPPSVSVPLSALFYALFWLVLGFPVAHAFAAGFLGGYLAYDMTHYHLHHHTPRTWLGKRLRELHMRHHFQDDTRGFGVSAPYWDPVFRSAQRRAPERQTGTPGRAGRRRRERLSSSRTAGSCRARRARMWRNWQTRTVQVRVGETPWRFESSHPHRPAAARSGMPYWAEPRRPSSPRRPPAPSGPRHARPAAPWRRIPRASSAGRGPARRR